MSAAIPNTVHGLRKQLEQRIGRVERAPHRTLSSGIESLDQMLPGGGVPKGHISLLQGSLGDGRTSFALLLIARVVHQGGRAVVVDTDGTWDPNCFAAADIPTDHVWVVSPKSQRQAIWSADLLVRSGHFGLVYIGELERPLRTAEHVRLQRWARESETVVLLAGDRYTRSSPGGLNLSFSVAELEWEEGVAGPVTPTRVHFQIQLSKHQRTARVCMPCRSRQLLGKHDGPPDRKPTNWHHDYAGAWA
ncbi:MAG: hypothetical protein KC561_07635 [Myxococcales bacterium]|nr:hypothetical protein [Myxococcales bacterium]